MDFMMIIMRSYKLQIEGRCKEVYFCINIHCVGKFDLHCLHGVYSDTNSRNELKIATLLKRSLPIPEEITLKWDVLPESHKRVILET